MMSLSEYTKSRNYSFKIGEDPSRWTGRLRICSSIIRKLPPGTFLDIGCADGTWAKYWQDRGWKTFGVDINPKNVDITKKRGIQATTVDLNSEEPLQFENDSFDLIFAGEIIEHLIDTDGFLMELNRCLKPKANLLITTPNLVSFENRIRILFGRYPTWVDFGLHGSGHVRAYTPRVLKYQLKQQGFSIQKQTGNWVPFIPQQFVDDVKLPLLSLSGKVFPNLAMDIIVLARKETKSL